MRRNFRELFSNSRNKKFYDFRILNSCCGRYNFLPKMIRIRESWNNTSVKAMQNFDYSSRYQK